MVNLRYDVAISFAGEDRMVAEEIATGLLARKYRVFYDRFEQHTLLGEDLGGYLPNVYSEQSRYCVVVVSDSYARKVWTRLELKSAIAGAIFGEGARNTSVLPLRLDDTRLSGLQPTVGYLDLRELDASEAVDVLVQKIGPPMNAADQNSSAVGGIAEAIAICRWHLRPRMNATALQEFSAALRKHIVFVRPREAQQSVAGIISELDLAARLRRDRPRHDADILFDNTVVRIEDAVRALAEISGKPVESTSPDPVKNRRGRLIVLAVGCVLAIAIGVWAVIGKDGAPADARSSSAATTSTSVGATPKPASVTTSVSSRPVGGVIDSPSVPVSTASASPRPTPPPGPARQPERLSLGDIVLVPTDGLDLDAGTPGHQDDPGMDISPSKDGNLIYGMSHGKPRLAVVTSTAATGPGLCGTVPADAWRTPLSGLYEMRVGDRICVLTDRGNHGVLTLRTVPSAGAADLDIDYVAWQG